MEVAGPGVVHNGHYYLPVRVFPTPVNAFFLPTPQSTQIQGFQWTAMSPVGVQIPTFDQINQIVTQPPITVTLVVTTAAIVPYVAPMIPHIANVPHIATSAMNTANVPYTALDVFDAALNIPHTVANV